MNSTEDIKLLKLELDDARTSCDRVSRIALRLLTNECKKHSSIETLDEYMDAGGGECQLCLVEKSKLIDNMAMLIRRMQRRLNRASSSPEDQEIILETDRFLMRNGLEGSLLRNELGVTDFKQV